jgi:hypothetical protein
VVKEKIDFKNLKQVLWYYVYYIRLPMATYHLEPVYQYTDNPPVYSPASASTDPPIYSPIYSPMYSQPHASIQSQPYASIQSQTYAPIPPQIYSPIQHHTGVVPITAVVSSEPPKFEWSCPKICATIIVICVIIGIVIGIGYLGFNSWCNRSDTTFKYCKCDKYNIRTEDAHVCYFNRNDTIMTCTMDTGYYVCNASTNSCPLNFAGKGGGAGWGNCVFVPSETVTQKTGICDSFTYGREICFTKNRTCCWYTN